MIMAARTISALLALTAGIAQAHPGHDAPSALHWHAFDTWGWALALAVAAGAWWWARRK
jgi:hypothetical protein